MFDHPLFQLTVDAIERPLMCLEASHYLAVLSHLSLHPLDVELQSHVSPVAFVLTK